VLTCGLEESHTDQHLQDYRRILRGLLSAEVDRDHGSRRELRLSGNGAGGSVYCWCSDNAVLGKEMATRLPSTGDSRELNVIPRLTWHAIASAFVHDSTDGPLSLYRLSNIQISQQPVLALNHDT
jgi:hypothetical protein